MTERILITGGTGYIGSHTAVVLSQLGHDIVLYDNLSNSSDAILDVLQEVTGKPIPFVKGDIRDTDLLIHTLKSHNIDAIIHFAGLKAVGESVEKPLDYFANNIQGAISLLKALQTQSINTFIFSSSATVYGEPQYLPFDEEHPTNALTPYGRSKKHVEEILQDLASSNPALRISCLRYFNPVGAHESGLIGENPKGRPNNLMPFIAQVAIGDREELSVFGDDYPTSDGTGVRDYIHVMDLAEGHAASLTFLENNTGWHAFNLGSGTGYSVLELIHAFEEEANCTIPYRIINRRAGDIAEYYSNPDKAAKLLGWKTKRNLNEMCSSTWQFQKKLN